MRWAVYKDLVGKPEVKSTHGRPWRGWEDEIKMGLKTDWLGGC
jgi:hypothetical protein